MPNKVRVLSESVVAKIAAGEVIERPASVVKELVENSIDAGSSEIQVIVEGGGKSLIEVRDNGEGMEREDALLALERHATSKIRNEEDLFNINSLGFRGEALPSISAVSRMELITKVYGAISGTYILIEGGKIKEVREEGCPPGTVVRVKDLFFNLPARMKFMKSTTLEASYIHDSIIKIAMARPEVGFRYIQGKKTILDSSPTGNFIKRIAGLLGIDTTSHLYPLKEELKGAKLEGFISHPNLIRSTASSIYLFVNRRPIHDRSLISAILQGYYPLIPKGRYPVAILYITVSPGDVDINVHPSKREVRFRNSGDIYELILRGVKRFVRDEAWIKGEALQNERPGNLQVYSNDIRYLIEKRDNWGYKIGHSRLFSLKSQNLMEEQLPFEAPGGFFTSLSYLGQIDGTYLILVSKKGIVIIDQHAAHERVLFEKIKKNRYLLKGIAQPLLIPISVELSQMESSLLENYADCLRQVGVEVVPFGERTWKIEALPPWKFKSHGSNILHEIVGRLMEGGHSLLAEEAIERTAAVLACHGAIQAKSPIERDQVMELLKEMDQTPSAGICPHGRPTFIEIDIKEMERKFGRS